MAENYPIPKNPEYNPNIPQIQNGDYVDAEAVLNPVLQRIIENQAAHQLLKADLVDGKVSESQMPEMNYDAAGAAEAVQKRLSAHISSNNNPHRVTAAQIGAQALTNGISITIPITGWSSDSTAGYPNYCDITVAGLTVKDRADLVIAPESLPVAKACCMCSATETLAGKIRLRAASIPTAAIAAEYWIEKGQV